MVIALVMVNFNFDTRQTIDISEFVGRVKAGEVNTVEVNGQELAITFSDESQALAYKELDESLVQMLNNYGVASEQVAGINIKVEETKTEWYVLILPYLLPLLL
ncbi:hypothetical protein GWN26_08775, partial [Candidatus Saccharibacteria bacterium]|nr:hypothetical protein [Candidatus Saccharibacteria bacterium]